MSTINQFLDELAERRTKLADERDRLNDLIEQVDSILQQYRQELKRAGRSGMSVKDSLQADRDALRAEIVRQCKKAFPKGLTSEELFDAIAPHWTQGELSSRRVGTLATRTPELAGGNGGAWYYVPAEGEDMEGSTAKEAD